MHIGAPFLQPGLEAAQRVLRLEIEVHAVHVAQLPHLQDRPRPCRATRQPHPPYEPEPCVEAAFRVVSLISENLVVVKRTDLVVVVIVVMRTQQLVLATTLAVGSPGSLSLRAQSPV